MEELQTVIGSGSTTSTASTSSDIQNQTDTESGSTPFASSSMIQPASSEATSSIALVQSNSESGSTLSAASFDEQSTSAAATSSLSSLPSSSSATFTFTLPSIRFISDAPHAVSTPQFAIAKIGDIQSVKDIAGRIHVTLKGFGKALVTDMRMEETSEEILIFVDTPAVFRPGEYDMTVSWMQSRSDLRLMEKLFQVSNDGEETILLQKRIALGLLPPEAQRVQTIETTNDVLSVTRTSVVRTSPGEEETMIITVTPHATFMGSITERVPAGFTVRDVTPIAEIDETEDGTLIIWNREFFGQAPLTLTYAFTAAPVSPLFAQFGRLEAKGTVTDVASEKNVVKEAAHEQATEETEATDTNEDLAFENTSSSEIFSAASSVNPGFQSGSDINESADGSDRSSAAFSDSSVAVASSFSSESSVASVAGASSESPASTDTGATLSWLRSLFAQLLYGEPFRFTEDTRWAMVVLPNAGENEMRTAEVLQLIPKSNGIFDANAMPSFTLIENVVNETGTTVMDTGGRYTEEAAYTAIVHALTDEARIKEMALADLLNEKKEDIADAIANDSIAVNILLDGSVPGNAKRAATTKAAESLLSEEMRNRASNILGKDAEIQRALNAVVTVEREQDIVEQTIRKNAGKKVRKTNELLSEENGTSAVESVTESVVDAIYSADDLKQKLAESIVKKQKDRNDDNDDDGVPIMQVRLTNKNGKTVIPNYHFVPGSVVLVLEPERAFEPGLYTLEITVFNPITKETTVQTADFAWGVLAINPSQDRYNAGDIIDLSIGVLDDGGRIVCDADLKLEVYRKEATEDSDATEETEEHVASLTTENGSIATGDSCGVKEAGLITPDYATSFTAVEAGTYVLTLTATTENGTRSMTSTIEVNDPPFLIRRIGATRLWPLGPSPMHITVTFNSPVTGTIAETVPPGFVVSEIHPSANVWKEEDGSTTLRWRGSWKEGEQTTFRYQYDAPDISPQFYLLGPLKISSALPFFEAP